MLPCPHCGTPTTVAETRQPGSLRNRAVDEFAADWPDLVLRRRRCTKCGGKTLLTVELPWSDLVEVARGPGVEGRAGAGSLEEG